MLVFLVNGKKTKRLKKNVYFESHILISEYVLYRPTVPPQASAFGKWNLTYDLMIVIGPA